MDCATSMALREYEAKIDRADGISEMWIQDTKHLYEQLEKIAEEYGSIALRYEEDFNVDIDWLEDAEQALGK
jgi:hypothetical protein